MDAESFGRQNSGSYGATGEGAPGVLILRKVFERRGLGLDLDADTGSFWCKVFKASQLIQPVSVALAHEVDSN